MQDENEKAVRAPSLRYTSDGALAECPCCGSLDVGGAHDTVSCYGCGLNIKAPRPLQNAIDAWNRRAALQSQVSNTPQDGSLIEGVPAARSEACGKFNAMVDEYIEDYEYDDGEACHSPSELERTLIADAIHGLLGLQEFIPLFLAWQSQCPAWHQFAAPPQQQESEAALNAIVTNLIGASK